MATVLDIVWDEQSTARSPQSAVYLHLVARLRASFRVCSYSDVVRNGDDALVPFLTGELGIPTVIQERLCRERNFHERDHLCDAHRSCRDDDR